MFVLFSRIAKKYWVFAGSLVVIFSAMIGLVLHEGVSREIAGVAGSVASSTSLSGTAVSPQKKEKSLAERMQEAQARAANIKGLYMTADVANDQGRGATGLRNNIIALAEKTEINAVVIDVKEVCGPDYDEKHLGSLLTELHQKNIWAIARIVSFKDASQINAHPEWYLKRTVAKAIPDAGCARKKYLRAPAPAGGGAPSAPLWQDNKGGYWMDPASSGARQYIVDLAKKMADLGFDEVQFDYVRFPSDGDVAKAVYPAWDGKTPKYVVMKSFFKFLHDNLKAYKPELILSADLFGYVATSGSDVGIGQRLEDVGDNFDFVSLMVYPSHYYSGLILPADPVRKLPAIHWNVNQARTNPGMLVERAMFFAEDLLNKRTASSSLVAASSTVPVAQSGTTTHHAQLRPWLEDFFHEADRVAGRPSGELKVQLQTDAAEKSSQHGWLLWNASNLYTESALKAE